MLGTPSAADVCSDMQNLAPTRLAGRGGRGIIGRGSTLQTSLSSAHLAPPANQAILFLRSASKSEHLRKPWRGLQCHYCQLPSSLRCLSAHRFLWLLMLAPLDHRRTMHLLRISSWSKLLVPKRSIRSALAPIFYFACFLLQSSLGRWCTVWDLRTVAPGGS